MVTIEGLKETAIGIGEDVKTFVAEKPLTTLAVGVGVVGVTALGVAVATRNKKVAKKKKKTIRKRTTRGRSRDRKFISKQKHEIKRRRKRPAKIYKKKGKYTSRIPLRKSKRTTKKRVGKIYMTKNGQPYKIMASGKARFIKKGGKR